MRTGKHEVLYDDGTTEPMMLAEEKVEFFDDEPLPSRTAAGDKRPTLPASTAAIKTRQIAPKGPEVRVQRIGLLVWAKTPPHPYWPAETCVPSQNEINEHFPKTTTGRKVRLSFRPSLRAHCVLSFFPSLLPISLVPTQNSIHSPPPRPFHHLICSP